MFNYKKAVHAISYFAEKEENKIIDRLSIVKLLFFVDKYHIRKFGRLIIDDTYFAMSYGPVGSKVKNLASLDTEWLNRNEREYAEMFIEKVGTYKIKSKLPFGEYEKFFGKNELNSMECIWTAFGGKNLVMESHKYFEWKRHERALSDSSSIYMNYMDFFSFIEDKNDPFYLDSDYLEESKNEFKEYQNIKKIFS